MDFLHIIHEEPPPNGEVARVEPLSEEEEKAWRHWAHRQRNARGSMRPTMRRLFATLDAERARTKAAHEAGFAAGVEAAERDFSKRRME